MRSDSGFLSIYDENEKEMENIEILLCEEGTKLVMSSYSIQWNPL